MTRTLARWIIGVVAAISMAPSFGAPLITWEYSFTPTEFTGGPSPIPALSVPLFVEGVLQYEANVSGRTGTGGQEYELVSSRVTLNGIQLRTGVTNASGNTANRVRVFNDIGTPQRDLVSVAQTVNQEFEGFLLEAVGLVFRDGSNSISSFDLSPTIFDRFNDPEGRIGYTEDGTSEWIAYGALDIHRVSEPSALWSIIGGLMALSWYRLYRRGKQQHAYGEPARGRG